MVRWTIWINLRKTYTGVICLWNICSHNWREIGIEKVLKVFCSRIGELPMGTNIEYINNLSWCQRLGVSLKHRIWVLIFDDWLLAHHFDDDGPALGISSENCIWVRLIWGWRSATGMRRLSVWYESQPNVCRGVGTDAPFPSSDWALPAVSGHAGPLHHTLMGVWQWVRFTILLTCKKTDQNIQTILWQRRTNRTLWSLLTDDFRDRWRPRIAQFAATSHLEEPWSDSYVEANSPLATRVLHPDSAQTDVCDATLGHEYSTRCAYANKTQFVAVAVGCGPHSLLETYNHQNRSKSLEREFLVSHKRRG